MIYINYTMPAIKVSQWITTEGALGGLRALLADSKMVFRLRSSVLLMLLSLNFGSGQAAQLAHTNRAEMSRTPGADALVAALSSARVAEPQRLAAVLTGPFKLEPSDHWLADLRWPSVAKSFSRPLSSVDCPCLELFVECTENH